MNNPEALREALAQLVDAVTVDMRENKRTDSYLLMRLADARAALEANRTPEPREHDWQIWPETDGLEQRCRVCGEYRRTPEEDKFWKRATPQAKGKP